MKPSGAANYGVSRPRHARIHAEWSRPIRRRCGRWCGWTGTGTRSRSSARCAATVPRASRLMARAWRGHPRSGEHGDLDLGCCAGTLRRLTFAPGMDALPVWTPDGRGSSSCRTSRGRAEPVQPGRRRRRDRRAADNEREPAVVNVGHVRRDAPLRLRPRPREGAGSRSCRSPGRMAQSRDAEPAPRRNAGRQSLFRGAFPEISPDGRYVAYQSDESGRRSGVRAVVPPGEDGLWQISRAARHGRCGRGADASCSTSMNRVRSSGCRVRTSGATHRREARRRCSIPSMSRPIPPATTMCRLMASDL